MKPERRFIAALTKFAAVFRVEMTDVLIEAYWEALGAWPIEGLEGGARTLIRESRFFPRPVEWAEAAEDFLRERLSQEQSRRLRLAQSNEPPLRAEDVRQLVRDLGEQMRWE